jgi:hypothetical protein
MIAALLLAASMTGQGPPNDNVGWLWTGNGYVLATLDKTKPVKFQGGSISCDLTWKQGLDGNGGGFESPSLDVGLPHTIRLQLYQRFPGHGKEDTWGLLEVGDKPPINSTGDFMVEFDSASAGPLNASGTTTRLRMWAINRAGAINYTLTQ